MTKPDQATIALATAVIRQLKGIVGALEEWLKAKTK